MAMAVHFSGIYRAHGSSAMHWATQYAQAIQKSHWQSRQAVITPVVYPWSEDDGMSWQAILLTGKESQDFLDIESASKLLNTLPEGRAPFLSQVQAGYAMSPQAIDVYV